MPMLEIPAGKIAYDERGSGPAIVMLASGAHDRHDYDELRALLPNSWRTIAFDWPAHGESPPGSQPGTAMQLADVTEQVVERLAPEGAIVIGNSVGGFSAARMAIRRPELVKALVIVDGGGFAGAPPHVRAFCALMSKPRFLRAIYPTFSKRYMRSRTDADRRAQATGVATTRQDPGLRAVAELWSSFASPEHDLRSRAHSIAAPTLVIWGKRDPVIPVKLGRKLAATIPSAKLVEFDTGHVPHTSEPQRFATELLAFIDSAEDRAAGAGVSDQLPV